MIINVVFVFRSKFVEVVLHLVLSIAILHLVSMVVNSLGEGKISVVGWAHVVVVGHQVVNVSHWHNLVQVVLHLENVVAILHVVSVSLNSFRERRPVVELLPVSVHVVWLLII